MTSENLSGTVVHVLDLPTRSVRVEITDRSDKIEFALWFSKIGHFGDMGEITKWLQPLYEKYDFDQRPQFHKSLNTEERWVVVDNGKHFAAVALPVEKP